MLKEFLFTKYCHILVNESIDILVVLYVSKKIVSKYSLKNYFPITT